MKPAKSSERGTVLIFVAITLAVLMGMAAFAFDVGVFWTARGQAQNAADAGALAGATALALDDGTWPIPSGGQVETSATKVAQVNLVAGASGAVRVLSECPPFAPYTTAPYNTNCIRVDVHRDGQFSSATLPTYFANVFGVSTQAIKATATAQVSVANGSGCMRPWFIVDKYTDANGNGIYDGGDTYTPPGYQAPGDIGTSIQLYTGGGPSSYGQLDVGNGANDIGNAIRYCATSPPTFHIGQVLVTKPGANAGQVRMAMDDLIAWDPSATLNASNKVVNSCADTGTCACPSAAQCPYGGTMSPRIVQAAICSPVQGDCNGSVNGAGSITVVNILSFFITGSSTQMGKAVIHATIISSAGEIVTGPTVGPGGSFLTATRLIR